MGLIVSNSFFGRLRQRASISGQSSRPQITYQKAEITTNNRQQPMSVAYSEIEINTNAAMFMGDYIGWLEN